MPFAITVQSRYSEGPGSPALTRTMPTIPWILEHVVDWAQDWEERPEVSGPTNSGDPILKLEWDQDNLTVAVYPIVFADDANPIA